MIIVRRERDDWDALKMATAIEDAGGLLISVASSGAMWTPTAFTVWGRVADQAMADDADARRAADFNQLATTVGDEL